MHIMSKNNRIIMSGCCEMVQIPTFMLANFCMDIKLILIVIQYRQVSIVSKKGKIESAGTGSVAWVYDGNTGWINVNLFLKRIEKLEKEVIHAKFQDEEIRYMKCV